MAEGQSCGRLTAAEHRRVHFESDTGVSDECLQTSAKTQWMAPVGEGFEPSVEMEGDQTGASHKIGCRDLGKAHGGHGPGGTTPSPLQRPLATLVELHSVDEGFYLRCPDIIP
jgi:hypothetical protein